MTTHPPNSKQNAGYKKKMKRRTGKLASAMVEVVLADEYQYAGE